MQESLLISSLKTIASQRREAFLSLGKAVAAGLSTSFVAMLLVSALLYIPYALAPRQFSGLALNPDQNLPLLGFGIGWLLAFVSLYWFAVLGASFAQGLAQPARKGLPLAQLMGYSACLALGPALAAAAGSLAGGEIGLLLALGLWLPVQVMFSAMVIRWARSRVEPAGRSTLRDLVPVCVAYYLLLILTGLFVTYAQGQPSEPVLGLLAGGLNLIVWLGASLLVGAASVQARQVHNPEPETVEPPAQRPVWAVFAAMGAATLAIYGGLYGWQMNEIARMEQEWQPLAAARSERANYRRPVLRGQALKGNGAQDYLSVIGKDAKGVVFSLDKLDKELISAWFEKRENLDGTLKAVAASERRYATPMITLRRAMQHEQIDFKPSFRIDEQLPNFIGSQDLAKVQTLMAVAKCRQGACGEGLRTFTDTLRLGQDVGAQGWLISGMVGVVIQTNAIKGFGQSFDPAWAKPAEYRQALGEIRALMAARPDLLDTVQNEAGMLMQMPLEMARQGGKSLATISFDSSEAASTGPLEELQFIYFLPQLLDANRIGKEFLSFWQSLEGKPYPELKKALADWDARAERLSSENVLASIMMPNFPGALDRYARADAMLAGYYQFLALQAYHQAHKTYPEQLAQLVPAWLPELPSDPFTGKPFVYKRLSPQDFRLYSLDTNQVDDQGQGVYSGKNCPSADLVFAPGKARKECEY